MTDADSQCPTSENSDSRSALVVSNERFRTKIFLPISHSWPIRGPLVLSRLLGRRDRSSGGGTEGPHKQKDAMACISGARGAQPTGSMPGYQPRAAIEEEEKSSTSRSGMLVLIADATVVSFSVRLQHSPPSITRRAPCRSLLLTPQGIRSRDAARLTPRALELRVATDSDVSADVGGVPRLRSETASRLKGLRAVGVCSQADMRSTHEPAPQSASRAPASRRPP